jgi:hypothetical protein
MSGTMVDIMEPSMGDVRDSPNIIISLRVMP